MKSKHHERGTSLLEFTIVAPFLVILLFGVVDIGDALNKYIRVSRIAYESARYGSRLVGLEQGEVLNQINSDGKDSLTSSIVNPVPGVALEDTYQKRLHERIKTLLADNNVPADSVSVTTCYRSENPLASAGCTFLDRNQLVGVRIRMQFTPLSQRLGLMIGVAATAPYLVRG